MTGRKILFLSPLVALLIGGIYLLIVFEHRKDPGVIHNAAPADNLAQDELAVVRVKYPAHFEDASDIDNTTVWMKGGNTMPYYPYINNSVQFSKRVGLIPPMQKLFIKKLVKQATPSKEQNNISHGTRQVFALFTLPDSPTVYATPIGVIAGQEEHYFSDLLFFYDDPHGIYDNWSKETWKVIDAHQVKEGMNELQTRMSIGMKLQTSGSTEGERVVTYEADGKTYTINYEKDRATHIDIK
jgi:hypothetical protein